MEVREHNPQIRYRMCREFLSVLLVVVFFLFRIRYNIVVLCLIVLLCLFGLFLVLCPLLVLLIFDSNFSYNFSFLLSIYTIISYIINYVLTLHNK